MTDVPAHASSLTESVYDDLRGELLNGILCPGEKLKLVELAHRYEVSQSVIREALTRLAERSLVVASPQRGFRVRDLSIQDITDLTEARVQIESLTMRMSIERGDMRWETDVLATHHILDRTQLMHPDGRFNEEWTLRHRDYHRAAQRLPQRTP